MINQVLLVGAGGFLGAIFRYFISQSWNKPIPHFPLGTLTVNLVGSFFLGVLAGGDFSEMWLLLLGTGFLGAFTTFSTLSWESVQLAQSKQWGRLFLYIGITYTVGILLAFAGYFVGTMFWRS